MALEREIGRIVGHRWVLTSRLAREAYAYDGGMAEGLPDLVVFPGNRDELASVTALCYRQGVPVIPRGAGTCLSGGPVPVSGGVVVALTRMNRILVLDPEDRVAVVEPGVTNLDLQRAAAGWNLMFPPDPASQAVSTLGGNVAENAGGPRAARYGVSRQHVMGLELVLPDGTVAALGQLENPVPCPDLPRPLLELTSLLAGCEGTLAFITRLALRLTPLPRQHGTMLAFFSSMEQAAEAISHLIAARMLPAALEIMGRLDIGLAEEQLHLGLPTDAEAMLLVEVDGPGPALPRQLLLAEQIARQAGGTAIRSATDPLERERLWAARRASAGMYGRLKPTYLTLDVTVPRHRVPDMFRKVAELIRQTSLPISLLGHMGDGNLHPAVLLDDRRPGELERALEVSRVLVGEALRLGGTLTGEHGIGTEKLEFMPLTFSCSTIDYFRRIKLAFDPKWQLNPGKLVPNLEDEPAPARLEVGSRPLHSAPERAKPHSRGDTERALRELDQALGVRLVTEDAQMAAFGFGGKHRPAAVVLPTTTEELAETVRVLAAHGVPVWPVGTGELVRTAFAPFVGGVAVSTAGLHKVEDVTLENLSATVQAGCHPGELDRALGTAGPCMYPVDCWRSPRSTLGGEIATNASGPERPRYGATRDNLLGLAFLDSQGRICRVGGQSVKNVSGYDVTHLLCGSWGALGILLEATVRLWPRPETRCTLATTARRATEFQVFLRDLSRCGCDAPVQLLSPGSDGDAWMLLISLAGFEEDVAWWTQQVHERAHLHHLEVHVLPEAQAEEAWDTVRQRAGSAWCRQLNAAADACTPPGPPGWAVGYVLVPPSVLPAVAEDLYRTGVGGGCRVTLNACCFLGTIDLMLEGPGPEIRGLLHRWQQMLGGNGGLGLYGWHDSLEPEVIPWHPKAAYHPATRDLVTRLKRQLDPDSILCPTVRLL
ncbi:MAG: FAD-binding protein [Bacillota bacterium]